MQPVVKGYALAFLATIAVSTVYIFSKAALNEVSLPQFGVYWFAMALFWNGLFALRSKEHRHFHHISGRAFKTLFFLGLVEIVATTSLYSAIAITPNPAIPSFLRNMEYIFVTLFGVFFLKEHFTRTEISGILLTFTGAFVISFQKGADLLDYISGTSGLMLISTSFYGIRTILAKKNIKTITPTMLAVNRAIFLLIFAFVLLKILGHSLLIPHSALINIAFGSFLGPFLTSFSQYSALKYIEASRSSIIQSSTALFVLGGAYLFFGKFPAGYQLAGGLLTVAGVLLLLSGKMSSLKINRRH
ncbi:MAG TPA: DMT family transporter [Bacteroidales bacterium]|nr:DMT family transporter [Bacteroidales bacterium]HRW96056.1 DMT family transporter [Bacteroidales bacterium]